MSDEHPEHEHPGEPRDPDPADESPADADGDTERDEREEPELPGIATGDEPDVSS